MSSILITLSQNHPSYFTMNRQMEPQYQYLKTYLIATSSILLTHFQGLCICVYLFIYLACERSDTIFSHLIYGILQLHTLFIIITENNCR
jgi:hypothetical protein